MLTANRFDEIKSQIKRLMALQSRNISPGDISDMLDAMIVLAAEVDRLRTPAKAGGRGHLKPVILDAKGNAVAPPPISSQLAAERREQFERDRLDAIMALPDCGPWRVFSLRWGLAPPPGGWDNQDIQLRVIHQVRLGVKQVPLFQKTISASWLTSNGIALPRGVTLERGVLMGVELPD